MNTTTNLADFGTRELKMVRDLLSAMLEQGLPDDFENDGVVPMMNQNSGNVFLTNSEFQVAMLNGDKLESFYNSPYEGKEGFFDELLNEYADMHHEDQEWFKDLAESLGRTDELPEDTVTSRPTFEQAKKEYVHRYTMEHIPEWAKTRSCDHGGTETRYYAPQYRTDAEWYENTMFPEEMECGDDGEYQDAAHSINQSWPLGQWLDKPYTK